MSIVGQLNLVPSQIRQMRDQCRQQGLLISGDIVRFCLYWSRRSHEPQACSKAMTVANEIKLVGTTAKDPCPFSFSHHFSSRTTAVP